MADRLMKKLGAVLLTLAVALSFTFAIVHPAKADPVWTQVSADASEMMSDVAYGNGCFIAISYDSGKVYKSTNNGQTWTLKYTASRNLGYIAFGNGTFIATDNNREYVFYSTDSGETWHELQIGSHGGSLGGIVYGSSGFVAVGSWSSSKGSIFTSANGITGWTNPFFQSDPDGISGMVFSNVGYGNGTYIVVGDRGRIYHSTNASTWTLSASVPNTDYYMAVSYGNGLFAAASMSGSIITSDDGGVSWSTSYSSGYTFNDIAYCGGCFYAVGFGGVIVRSSDGINWSDDTSGTAEDLWGIGYGSGYSIAMGTNGLTLVRQPSSDASLLRVLSITDSSVSGTGTAGDPVQWGISVDNAVSSYSASSVSAADGATVNLYSNAGFSNEITGTDSLTEGAAKTVYIKVTAEDGAAVKYYAVSIFRELSDAAAPALSAVEAARTGAAAATVKFSSDEAGAYYYGVVEAGSDAPAIATGGAGTALAVGENTISLTGLAAGAKDIYIKAKDAASNVSAALKMNIPAYVAPGTVLFDFGTGGDMPGESAISYQDPVSHETITLTADVPLSLHLAQDNSDDSNGILGGTDFTGMSGRTVATGTGATVTSVRITVPGPTFDLISLNFYDCFEIGYPFILMNDKGEFASFPTNIGTGSNFVDVSSSSIFKGVKYVDILSDAGDFMPALDNIVLANIAPPDTTPPALTGISVSRPDNGYASVTFTSDEAGAFYYRSVADGAPEPTIDTNATDDSLCGLMAGVNNFTVSQLTAGAWDLYIKAKDHAGNVSATAYKIDIPAYAAAPDTTPPTLTPGTATRQSDTSATASFTTDEAGTLYYIVVADGAPEPTIDTSGPGAPCLEGPGAVYPGTLTADACDIYIKEKDAAGNVSAALKMDIPAYVNPDATPPTLSSGEAYRLSATTAVVIFNSDEIGDYYYQVVADGAPEPTINTSGAGTSGVAGGNNLDLTALTAGACDVYIVVKDAANNVSAALKVDIPAYVAPDMTPPVLTAGTVSRSDPFSGTVTFTSDEAGAYYYSFVPDGAAAPTIDTNGPGIACVAGENTINLLPLPPTACDAYIQVKDAAGNVSDALKMDIPDYLAPDATPPALTAGTASRPDPISAMVTFTSNEAGAYYYAFVPDGLPEPFIDTNGLGAACVAGENTINLLPLPPMACDAYIKVKDAAGNVSASLKMDIPAYTPPDMTPPTLSAGESNRLSAASATVIFTSDETGAYYYQVVSDSEAAPPIDTSGVGSSLASGGNAIPLTDLDPGALDIYIKAKDAAGNVSAALKVDIPEFFVPVTGISGVPAMAWAGTDLTLTGTVSPEDATNKTIVWTVKDAGATGAIINGNILATANAGTAIVTATVVHGTSSVLDYSHDFTITVNPAMAHQTLQDQVETATISAEGILAQDAQLIVVPIAAGDSDREEMEDLLTGKNAVAAYEVTIQPAGAFQPPLVLTFQVDEKYNGRKVFILHKLSDGSMESFTPTVADGKAIITVNALSPFLLAVDPAVVITGQPQDTIALIGQTATFHVVADGQALTYKWQRRTGASAAWKDISGATGPDYTTSVVNKSHNGYQYRVIVSDSLGNSVTSDIATLTVTVSPDTGDHSQPLVYAALMILFAGLILWMLFKRRTA